MGISQTECGGPENRRASASAPRQSRRGRHRCANLANEPRVPCRNIPVIPVDPFGFHAKRTGYAMRRYSVTGAGLTHKWLDRDIFSTGSGGVHKQLTAAVPLEVGPISAHAFVHVVLLNICLASHLNIILGIP